MQTFSLRARLSVLLNGRRLVLANRLMDRRLAFKDDFGEPVVLTEAEFYRLYERRELALDPAQPYIDTIPLIRNAPPDLTCFPKAHSDEALRRRSYLEALFQPDGSRSPNDHELRKRLTAIHAVLNDAKPAPSPLTVRRWARRYRTMCVVQLVPQHCKKGRTAVIRGDLEDLLQISLEEAYLKPERPTISQVYEDLRSRVNGVNRGRLPSQQLRLPSEMTLRRYIDRLDRYQGDCERLGKHAADRKHRNATGQLTVDKILERWEIDHTLLDVLIVDPKSGEVIGRPYITVTIVLSKLSVSASNYALHATAHYTSIRVSSS